MHVEYLSDGKIQTAELRPRLRIIADWEQRHGISLFSLFKHADGPSEAATQFLAEVGLIPMLELLEQLTSPEVGAGIEALAERDGVIEAIATPFTNLVMAHLGGAGRVSEALGVNTNGQGEVEVAADPFEPSKK